MKSITIKLLLAINNILIILHISRLGGGETSLDVQSAAPILIAAVMLIDITYIASCNVRGNQVLNSFCGLLALDSWYVLLSTETAPDTSFIFNILGPVIGFASLQFILLFLFQGGGYRYRGLTNLLMSVSCFGAITGLFFSDTAYAGMYGIQFIVNILCFLFIAVYHRKRILFVLQSEKKCFLLSTGITAFCFGMYYLITLNQPGHLSNFGIYLPILLFLISVHTILLKEHAPDGLKHLKQEELLKTRFADYLHDDILQDLLSVKNMMSKAHRPDVRDIIMQTLDNLNTAIRNQMQDYHPVIRKNLTLKENFENLIEAVSLTFPQKKIAVSFECSDRLFLVEPYTVLVYRFIKELLTNVYKHSNAGGAFITLVQEKRTIRLTVSDDGTGTVNIADSADIAEHKGLLSIKEQVDGLNGIFLLSENIPHGCRIQITLPMKGDDSYQHFISR